MNSWQRHKLRSRKEKNKKKEKGGFLIKDRKEVKMEKIGGKQCNSQSMKEREWKIFRPYKQGNHNLTPYNLMQEESINEKWKHKMN